MSEPLTLGALCATIISMAADGAFKGGFGEAAKDAYSAIKNKIAQFGQGDVERLEQNPQSGARKAIVAEIVDGLSENDRALIRPLAQTLLAELKAERNIGMNIGDLEALEANFESIKVNDGVGVQIEKAKLKDGLNVGAVIVGKGGNR